VLRRYCSKRLTTSTLNSTSQSSTVFITSFILSTLHSRYGRLSVSFSGSVPGQELYIIPPNSSASMYLSISACLFKKSTPLFLTDASAEAISYSFVRPIQKVNSIPLSLAVFLSLSLSELDILVTVPELTSRMSKPILATLTAYSLKSASQLCVQYA